MISLKSTDGDLEEQLAEAGGEQLYLFVVDNCPFCEAMKDELEEHIESGLIEVVYIEENHQFATTVDLYLDEPLGAPSVIVETDEGEYVAYQ